MKLDERIKRKIAQCYRDGGFDSEAMVILIDYVEDFNLAKWNDWLANDTEFADYIANCRILAQAFWERMLREKGLNGEIALPAWYAAVKGQGMKQYDEKQAPVAPSGNVTINLIQDARSRIDAPMVVKEALGMIIEGNANG